MELLNLKTRPARKDDADFMSWLMLTAGRAHVKKGIWEVILSQTEKECLNFLKELSVTRIPHYFHYSSYRLAEVDGEPVAGLGGYDPAFLGNSALWAALPEVYSKLGGETAGIHLSNDSPKIISCIPDSVKGAWVIDSVAALERFRRKGIVSKLLKEIMEKGRKKGFKLAQINIYLGNVAAQRLYEKHGFRIIDEVHDPYFEAQIGSPGMACMLRNL
jgi:ribosomal protein S18 acetylase RimI-like enzyme